MKEYLFSKEHFTKWANCTAYDLSDGYNNNLRRLLDHGFIADRACVWGGIELDGHETAIISRTYCSENEIDNPPDGLLCIRLPNYIMGKDDLGIAIATVIVHQSKAANDYLNTCRNLPLDMLAFAIPRYLTWTHKLLVNISDYADYAEIKLVKTEIDDFDLPSSVDEVTTLLKEALSRIERPSGNANGGNWQAGGAYWRLAKAIKFIDNAMDHVEGKEHAKFIRENHWQLYKHAISKSHNAN